MVTRRSREALRAAALLAVACCFDGPFRLVVSLPIVMICLAVTSLALTNGRQADARPFPPVLWMLLASVAALGIAMPGNIGPLWVEILRRGFSAFGVVAVGVMSGTTRSGDAGHSWQRSREQRCCRSSSRGDSDPQSMSCRDRHRRPRLHGIHRTSAGSDVYNGGADWASSCACILHAATLLAFAIVAIAGDLIRPGRLRSGNNLAGPPCGPPFRSRSQLLDAATLMIALHPTMPVVVRSGWGGRARRRLRRSGRRARPRRSQVAAIGTLLLRRSAYAIAPVILSASGPRRARPRTCHRGSVPR